MNDLMQKIAEDSFINELNKIAASSWTTVETIAGRLGQAVTHKPIVTSSSAAEIGQRVGGAKIHSNEAFLRSMYGNKPLASPEIKEQFLQSYRRGPAQAIEAKHRPPGKFRQVLNKFIMNKPAQFAAQPITANVATPKYV